MNRVFRVLLVSVLVALPGLLLVSCSDDTSGPGPLPDCEDMPAMLAAAYDALEAKLYQHLQGGAPDPDEPDDVNFSAARALYQDAYACDNSNLEARFGLAVCDILVLSLDPDVNAAFDAWEEYLDLHTPFGRPDKDGGRGLASFLGMPAGAQALEMPFDLVRNTIVANVNAVAAGEPQVAEVQRILRETVLPAVESAVSLLGPVADAAEFRYEVSGMMQGDAEEVEAEIDHTDVLVLRAACRMLAAGIHVAVAYDVQFEDYDAAGMLGGLHRDTGNIMRLLGGGSARMQAVPAIVLAAADDLGDAITSLLAETDDQDDDVIKIGPDDLSRTDVEEIRDTHIPDVRQAFAAAGVVYTENWDGDGSTPDSPLRINLHDFFSDPIADWKQKLPPYTLTTTVRPMNEYVGWYDESEYVTAYLFVPVGYSGSWRYYSAYVENYRLDDPWRENTFPAFDAFCADYIDARLAEVADLPDWDGNASFWFNHSGDLTPGTTDSLYIWVDWYYYQGDDFVYVPVVTWAADNFASWCDQMPDPTLNGLLPEMTDGAEVCSTFGYQASDWNKTMIWNWTDMEFQDPPNLD